METPHKVARTPQLPVSLLTCLLHLSSRHVAASPGRPVSIAGLDFIPISCHCLSPRAGDVGIAGAGRHPPAWMREPLGFASAWLGRLDLRPQNGREHLSAPSSSSCSLPGAAGRAGCPAGLAVPLPERRLSPPGSQNAVWEGRSSQNDVLVRFSQGPRCGSLMIQAVLILVSHKNVSDHFSVKIQEIFF